MKRLFSLFFLDIMLGFISLSLFSCSDFTGKDSGSVSFSLTSELVRAVSQTSADFDSYSSGVSALTDSPLYKIELTLDGDYKDTQSKSFSSAEWKALEVKVGSGGKESFTFQNIPAGASVKASASIYFMGIQIMEGSSSEKKISVGENTISLNLEFTSYPSSGSVSIKNGVKKCTLAKNSEQSSKNLYLDSGKFAFSLLDEKGNDLLSDVKWDAQDEALNFQNQNLFLVEYELKKGNHSIDDVLWDYGFNYCEISEESPLSESGTYLLTITVSPYPDEKNYVNKNGYSLPLPDFEPVSATFKIVVEEQ